MIRFKMKNNSSQKTYLTTLVDNERLKGLNPKNLFQFDVDNITIL